MLNFFPQQLKEIGSIILWWENLGIEDLNNLLKAMFVCGRAGFKPSSLTSEADLLPLHYIALSWVFFWRSTKGLLTLLDFFFLFYLTSHASLHYVIPAFNQTEICWRQGAELKRIQPFGLARKILGSNSALLTYLVVVWPWTWPWRKIIKF